MYRVTTTTPRWKISTGVCIDMRTGECGKNACAGMWTCVQACKQTWGKDMGKDMCTDVGTDMCIVMCIDMCADMCIV